MRLAGQGADLTLARMVVSSCSVARATCAVRPHRSSSVDRLGDVAVEASGRVQHGEEIVELVLGVEAAVGAGERLDTVEPVETPPRAVSPGHTAAVDLDIPRARVGEDRRPEPARVRRTPR